jgi:uncharacterized protein (TIGR02246 family)
MITAAGIRTSLVVAVLGLTACAPQHAYQGPPPAGPAPVSPGRETEMQIERAMDRYSSMLATMDADGLSAMYTPDGVMERQSGPPLRGREEIQAFLRAPANVHVLSNQMVTNSLAYNGPMVVQAGEFHQSARVNGKVVNASGRFEATWVRGPRGAWYISHMVTRPARN